MFSLIVCVAVITVLPLIAQQQGNNAGSAAKQRRCRRRRPLANNAFSGVAPPQSCNPSWEQFH
jgi:hypothetical protein